MTIDGRDDDDDNDGDDGYCSADECLGYSFLTVWLFFSYGYSFLMIICDVVFSARC